MEKKYSAIEIAQALLEKARNMVQEKLEKAEIKAVPLKNQDKDLDAKEISLPEGQLIPVTKENKDGMPQATGKTMEKAAPESRTSAQMMGVKVPAQPKPPKANEKVIDNTAAKELKPLKLKKFMQERGERLTKASEKQNGPKKADLKGVHKPAFMDSVKSGTSHVGAHIAPDFPLSPKGLAATKEDHKKVLHEIKAMPKPNLGKNESLEKGLKEKATAGLVAAGLAAGGITAGQSIKTAADLGAKAKEVKLSPAKLPIPAKPAMKKAEESDHKGRTRRLSSNVGHGDINGIITALNSTSGPMADKYPIGNKDLHEKVKAHEAAGHISHDPVTNKWKKGRK